MMNINGPRLLLAKIWCKFHIFCFKNLLYNFPFFDSRFSWGYVFWGKAMASYPQELAQNAVCQEPYRFHNQALVPAGPASRAE